MKLKLNVQLELESPPRPRKDSSLTKWLAAAVVASVLGVFVGSLAYAIMTGDYTAFIAAADAVKSLVRVVLLRT